MKVLILNTSEKKGGAAVAANRLMKALHKEGIEVNMLVRDKQTDDPNVFTYNLSLWKRGISFIRFIWERLIIFCNNKFDRKNLFRVSIANTGEDISNHYLVKEADIIHLHWINQGFLSIYNVQKLIKTGKPILWTMHDLWPATSICHYPGKCTKYKEMCFHCPMQIEHPFLDLAKINFKKKQNVDLSKITFIGCSNWITNLARESKLIHNSRFLSIPNPIDTSIFKPVNKVEARNQLQLPLDKKIALFAAAKLSDNRKGLSYLVEACSILKDIFVEELEILLMGDTDESYNRLFPFKVNSLGYLAQSERIVTAYSSADIFIIPSLEDNLPNTIMEAMACGTPCVGFETGGIPEMIDHKENGYIAKYKDTSDLAAGIQWVLNNNENLSLSKACVEKVKANYSEGVVAKQYISLYKNLLSI